MKRAALPAGKRFAFTIFDDTDNGTRENLTPVYRFLEDEGVFITKSVWPLDAPARADVGGATLADPAYREFVLDLQARGFEIALHNVRNGPSPRETVEEGLARFRDVVGHDPRIHANHTGCRENIYWGEERLSSRWARRAYRVAMARRDRSTDGEVAGSPFFWGDLCQQHITYVRGLVFGSTNLMRVNPTLPYHDSAKPFVNLWFTSSEGGNVASFRRTIDERRQDKLEEDGGVCIMYTHLASGFVADGRVDLDFARLIRRLAAKDGWFVPVSQLLDHLHGERPAHDAEISAAERRRMDAAWVAWKLRRGAS